MGAAVIYMSVIVLIPFAALVNGAFEDGSSSFWSAVSNPQAVAALKLTVGVSLVVTLVNAVMGTLIAWVLVRDRFVGKGLVNALIDLPFALPTIVAGLTLLALYGPSSPVGSGLAFSRALGEFGSLVLIAGNVPFDTQVSSLYIVGQIEADRPASAAAVSVSLLALSLAALLALSALERWSSRHAR